jgi:hypothetical protein
MPMCKVLTEFKQQALTVIDLTSVVILSNLSWSGVFTLSVTRFALIFPH